MIDNKILFADCCVIGCGISGIAVARWLKVSYLFQKENFFFKKII